MPLSVCEQCIELCTGYIRLIEMPTVCMGTCVRACACVCVYGNALQPDRLPELSTSGLIGRHLSERAFDESVSCFRRREHFKGLKLRHRCE